MRKKHWKCTFVLGNELCLSSLEVIADSLTGAINKLLDCLSEDFVDKYLSSVSFSKLICDE